MITDNYQAYEPKTRFEIYQRAPRFHTFTFLLDHSKMLKFVCWIRNLDGDYAASQWKTAGKVAVASLAVFGMLLTVPFGIGIFLLWKFIDNNKRVSADLRAGQFWDEQEQQQTEEHRDLIVALGGAKACQQIPTELYVHTQKITTGSAEDLIGFFDNEDNIRRQAAAEISEIFEKNKNPLFQASNNFVALWAENKETNERVICLIYQMKYLHFWNFEQLFEPYDADAEDRIRDLNASTIGAIVRGTHPEFRLVTFDN